MKKSNTLTLAQLGVFSAIIIVLTFTPLGMIPLGPVSATTVHIPVIIGAIVLGLKSGAILGGVLGVSSLLRALAMPASPLDPLFVNPVISVLPRICIGIVAALVFSALHRWIKGKASVPVSAGVAAVAGTLTNTILVLGLLVLIYPDSMGTDASRVFSVILTSIVAVNGIVEILSAVVLAIPVSAALFKLQQRLALPQAPTKRVKTAQKEPWEK